MDKIDLPLPSDKVEQLRNKLKKHLEEKANLATPSALSASLQTIRDWIAKYERIPLDSIGALFRKNSDTAPPSPAVTARMREITKRFQANNQADKNNSN